jgi:NAD(P)H-hydrate epimerase
MREMENIALDCGISSLRLMENAGSAAARCIRETLPVAGKRCTVLCGRGNNGGDGFVVARRLLEFNAQVTVIIACGSPCTPEATDMFERLSSLRPVIIDASQTQRCITALKGSDIIVDAVFGTGFRGVVTESQLTAFFDAVNVSGAQVFSLDMPSGANADTGEVAGVCIKAGYTVTFGAPKTGQFVFPAASFCGRIATVGIGLPESAFTLHGLSFELIDKDLVASMIPKRAIDSNKGDFGTVLCVCGSLGMAGAAYFAASGALRCGAGIVTLCVPQSVYLPVASKLNECLVYPFAATPAGSFAYSNLESIQEMAKKATVVLLGCGLSRDNEAQKLVRDIVGSVSCTIILDADGINAFEGHIDLLRTSKAKLILTPHPGEMARLCDKTIAEIQRSRLDTARQFATENNVTLVLKGANTIVAASDGRVFINPTGNPGMARGGSGDILSGMTAAFTSQGIEPVKAASCAVFIHGLAGDRCAEKLSQYGMLPSDMLMEIPQIFREMSR